VLPADDSVHLVAFIEAMVKRCPSGWQRLVVYREAQEVDGEIVGVSMIDCHVPGGVSDDVTLDVAAKEALDRYFEVVSRAGNPLRGLRVAMAKDGSYTSKHFYDDSPLFDDDYDEAQRRMDSDD
jgi:hypothetical protein